MIAKEGSLPAFTEEVDSPPYRLLNSWGVWGSRKKLFVLFLFVSRQSFSVVVLTVLELDLETRLALNSKRPACLYLIPKCCIPNRHTGLCFPPWAGVRDTQGMGRVGLVGQSSMTSSAT